MNPEEQDAVIARTVRELRAAESAHACYQTKLNQHVRDLELAWTTLARQLRDAHPETVKRLDYPNAEEALTTLHGLRKNEREAAERQAELDNLLRPAVNQA